MTDAGFRSAVLEHKDRVHAYAVGILRHREDARDVAQEALVRLWQHRDEVHDGAARTWLFRTAHHLCIDRLRRSAVRAESGLEPVEPLLPDSTPGPEREAASEQLGRHLDAALSRLSERDRAIVLMREVQGMSYEEIAEVLEMPLGTLKAALHRAREKLRESLLTAGVTP